ncbi:MAG: hypothetical protein Fur0043_09330 [Anaerolineales bacterium]
MRAKHPAYCPGAGIPEEAANEAVEIISKARADFNIKRIYSGMSLRGAFCLHCAAGTRVR